MRLGTIKRQLKACQDHIRPDDEWKVSTREHLLAHIRQTEAWQQTPVRHESGISVVARALFASHVLRPVMAVLLIFSLVFSSSALAVQAAKASLPGDTLYPVKLGFERVQVGLAFSETKKAELEISFATTRIKEVAEIVTSQGQKNSEEPVQTAAQQSVSDGIGVQNIGTAMEHFQKNIDSVKNRLDKIEKEPNFEKEALEISKLVNEKTQQIEENLLQIKEKIAQDNSSSTQQALQQEPQISEPSAADVESGEQVIKGAEGVIEGISASTTKESASSVVAVLDQGEAGVVAAGVDGTKKPTKEQTLILNAINGALEKVDEANTQSLEMFGGRAVESGDETVKKDAVEKIQAKIEKVEKDIEKTSVKIDLVSQSTKAAELSDDEIAEIVKNQESVGQGTSQPAQSTGQDNASQGMVDENAGANVSDKAAPAQAPEESSSNAVKDAAPAKASAEVATSTTQAVAPQAGKPTQLKQVIDGAKEKPKQAQQAIEEVKKILIEQKPGDLGSAVQKVKQAKEIVRQADKTIETFETKVKEKAVEKSDKKQSLQNQEQAVPDKAEVKEQGEVLGEQAIAPKESKSEDNQTGVQSKPEATSTPNSNSSQVIEAISTTTSENISI